VPAYRRQGKPLPGLIYIKPEKALPEYYQAQKGFPTYLQVGEASSGADFFTKSF